MKKRLAGLLAFLCCILLAFSGLTGCGKEERKEEDKKPKIVCTIFPEYDWVREILGDRAEDWDLTLLVGNGVDMHSFQPGVGDIVKISECDLLVYVGGVSDSWVEDALKNSVNPNQQALNLMALMGTAAKEEEHKEGMEEEKEEDGPELDEHVFLSLKNAALFVPEIQKALAKIDPEHAETYEKNAEAYLLALSEEDEKYQKTVEDADYDTLLFGDRFPFRYLVDDYGLSYYAAFAGCQAESEASFETIRFLSEKLDELRLPAVLVLEGSDLRLAETIIENTKDKDQKILVLDSMQGAGIRQVESGVTYLSIMEKNREVLKEALTKE